MVQRLARHIGMVVLAGLLVGSQAAGAAAVEPLTESYVDPSGVWELRYPHGWQVSVVQDDSWATIWNVESGSDSRDSHHIGISFFIDRSPDEHFTMSDLQCPAHGEFLVTLYSCGSEMIRGRRWLTSYSLEYADYQAKTLRWATAVAGKGYIATAKTHLAGAYRTRLALVRSIARTFKLRGLAQTGAPLSASLALAGMAAVVVGVLLRHLPESRSVRRFPRQSAI